jgi:hypothetical protein
MVDSSIVFTLVYVTIFLLSLSFLGIRPVLYISLTVYRIISVADPDPGVFGPPGSGSISTCYGSVSGLGSGSFYHQAKIVRKTYCFVIPDPGVKKALGPGYRIRIRNTASHTERQLFYWVA